MAVKPIVVAIDGSAEALRAVGWAVKEAVLRDAPLRIVSAAALPPRMTPRAGAHGPSTVAEIVTADRDRALAAAADRATAIAPGLLVSTDDLPGPIAQAVTDSGAGASMLVVGSRGAGAFAAMVLGSVSRYAATHAASPVVVVRDDSAASHQGNVVVGVRGPEDCAATLTFAFEEAALRNASLLAVHAWQADHRASCRTRTRCLVRMTGRRAPPGGWRACWPAGGRSTPASRSARKWCTATRAGR